MSKAMYWYQRLTEVLSKVYKSMLFPAAVVLIVILGITFWAARTAQTSLDRNLKNSVVMQTESLERAITNRYTLYVLFLRGATSTIDADREINTTRLTDYLLSYQTSRSGAVFPWMGIATRSDSAWDIRYIDPNNAADKTLSKEYGDAAAYAVSQNAATLKSYVDGKKRSVIIARPFYLEPGGTKPAGVLFGAIDADTFFSQAFTDADLEGFEVLIHASTGSNTPILYSKNDNSERYQTLNQKVYERSGEKLLLELGYDRYSLVNRTQVDGPLLIASGGALAALLIASIVYLLLTARTRELELQQAQDIDLAKDDLISLASHQLRTPATGVKQYLGMVLQGFAGSVSDSQKALLEKAYASNDRQLAVINEILHLAKIDSGRIVLSKRRINIVTLVQDVVSEQSRDLKEAGHILKTRYPKKPVWLEVDDHMLRMAIENLLSNAIKYTEAGGTIRVTLRATKREVIISVSDTGVGIPAADFSRLFQQFARIPNKLSSRVSGTGVGLYLAKHLVELHDGVMSVDSEEARGSTFSIILPKHDNM